LGLPVRAVSRTRPSGLGEGIEWRAADASDPAAAGAAGGASVIYQCLNAPYTDWPKRFPPVKGRTRAAMTEELLAAADAGRVRIAIGRASDFFGAGITTGTTLGSSSISWPAMSDTR
jgi:hypothetical protein